MVFREYCRVRLITDRFADEGARKGLIGYIIELYPDGNYEVEFSEPTSGVTSNQLVVSQDDIEALPE